MTTNIELTPVMKLDNDQLKRTMKMAQRKMDEARDIEIFEASFHLFEDAKQEIRRRDD